MDTTQYDWAAEATGALELPESARWVGDRDTVSWALDLAKDVAHGVARPAAPVATFLAGVAIELAGADDPQALERVRGQLSRTLEADDGDS